MYPPTKRKVDVSVADVVLDAIKQGAHKKVGSVETEEPKTMPLPVLASSSELNHPQTSIADIVLNTKTYSALHESASGSQDHEIHPSSSSSIPLPADTRSSHSSKRVMTPRQFESHVGGRASVRTCPPGKARSISLDVSVGLVTPKKKVKTEHPRAAGIFHMVRVSSKEFFSRIHKGLYSWRKQPSF